MFDRAILALRLDQLRAELASCATRAADLLRAEREYLRAQACAADAEWLFDRLADLCCEVGLSPNDARRMRKLAAHGGDPSALPYYAELPIGRPETSRHPLPVESALDRLAAGDGYMSWTWGYDPAARMAWLSDAQVGYSEADLECAYGVFRNALSDLGLELDLSA